MNIIYNTPTLKVLNCSKDMRRMTFLVEGLQQGKAETLAVALRRNIINFIPGLAPAAFKVLGNNQQYAPIKGLVNDTNDLSIIIKGLDVLAYDKETDDIPNQFIVEINRTYSNEPILFGDFALADGYKHLDFKVLNPEKVLTYVGEENVPVTIKVLIQLGVGYSPYNALNKKEDFPSDFDGSILVDSIFSPIETVSYEIKKQTPRQSTDSIVFTVETNGAITPIEAVYQAAESLIADATMISKLFDLGVNTYDAMLNVKYADTDYSRPGDTSMNSEVEKLALPTDIYDLVKDNSINSIGALVQVLEGTQISTRSNMKANKELLAKKDEIMSYLEKAGLTLEEE